MTLLVRNEADIVRQVIAYHLAHGVDHVIVTDNGSRDGTVEIIEPFVRAGVADLWHETGDDHQQNLWVTRMAVFARDERGANWVLNNDADEFWYHPSGTLKGALPSSASVLHMPRRNMLPPAVETGDDPVLAMRLAVIRPQPDRATPATLRTLGTKALCPAAGLREVHSGNHGAAFDTRVQEHVGHGIIGYHYPIRSRTQFTRKVVDGAAALGRNKTQPYETGRHWREWHKLYKAGKLDAEYDRLSVPDTEREALLRDGTIVEDRTISRCHPERNIKSNFAFARKLVGRGGMSWI